MYRPGWISETSGRTNKMLQKTIYGVFLKYPKYHALLVDTHVPVCVIRFIDLRGNDKHQIQGRGREGGAVSGVGNPGELSSGAGVLCFVLFFLSCTVIC